MFRTVLVSFFAPRKERFCSPSPNAGQQFVFAQILVFILLATIRNTANATEVSIGVSARETYVGASVVLQLKIEDAGNHDPPTLPDVDGLEIESAGPPSSSSQMSIINGRRSTSSSVIYNYRVTPTRAGSFTIPPIKVSAGGKQTITKAIRIVATNSETGDLLFVEIDGAKKSAYVGEAIELTLKIWVRPFTSKEYQVTLDEETMWRLLSDQTKWGPFSDQIQDLDEQRKRPRGESVLRKDSMGNEREYLLYEIDANIYPDRPGTIDGSDVRVMFNYPESLGRSRSPFSMLDDDPFFRDSLFGGFAGRLTVSKHRPIAAEAVVNGIEIKPIPAVGRPDDYQGAVGQYSIATTATPTSVHAGDPITLHIDISGSGPLDTVRPPPLSETPELTNEFKVADDSLSGIVDGSHKRFTTSIRPLNAGIKEIPAIALTYFDPHNERFVTTKSAPIPIDVIQSEELDLSSLARGTAVGVAPSAMDTSESSNQAAQSNRRVIDLNFGDLQTKQPARFLDSPTLGWLVIPPFIWLLAWMMRIGNQLPGGLFADREFQRAVRRADTVAAIADALEAHLTRKFRLHSDLASRDQTVGALRGRGLASLAIRTERLYAATDSLDSNPVKTDQWRQEAIAIVGELKLRRNHPLATPISFVLAITLCLSGQSLIANDSVLGQHKQRELLQQGVQDYQADRPVEAAEKLRRIVDSGVDNDRLYFNLASAYQRNRQLGLAVAAYRRALRIEPENNDYRRGLAQLENRQFPFVSPDLVRWSFNLSWLLFWGSMLMLLYRNTVSWKSIAVVSFILGAGTGALRFFDRYEFTRDDRAVIVQSSLSIRKGDGQEFELIAERQNAEGGVVTVLTNRAGWTKVLTNDGTTGWVSSEQLFALGPRE